MFASPLEKLSKNSESKITFSAFYLLIISIIPMKYIDSYLTNEITPNGIISFELSYSLEHALEILNSWSPTAKIFAGLSLGLDFLFLLIYTLFISILIHKLNQRLWIGKKIYRIGELLIWGMFITAIFDTVENVCLIKLLIGNTEYYWVSLAYYFAIAKFILIIIGIFYIIINFFIALLKRHS